LRCNCQRRTPLSASNAAMRLSMLRTMTMPCDTAGAPRISLDACAFQRCLPSAL
jgi:hypothetical protein